MKKKLLIAVTKSNFGGAQHYVFDLARTFKDEFEVVALAGGEGTLHQKLQAENIKTISLPTLERDISLWKEISSFFTLLSLVKKEAPDIIHLNSPKMAGLGALASRVARVPKIVTTVHGFSFQEDRSLLWKVSVWIFSWITILLSHTVILISQNDCRLAKQFPFASKKLFLVQIGIEKRIPLLSKEEARREILGHEKLSHGNDFWLGTIAELHPNKNLSSAILAVTEWNKTNEKKIFYGIVGDGEERKKLEALIQNQKAENSISLFGFRKDAPQFLSAFDIFLLPSKKEGLPYTLLEAGLASLPVIATPVGGIPEIIENEKTGILTSGASSPAILEALVKILTKPESELLSLGKRLEEKVVHQFSFARMIRAIREVYTNKKDRIQ
ncbi:MAG: glycosyltransferase [Patescibacteria group bacterium]